MLLAKPLDAFGDLKGTIYDFEIAGDILPMHEHDEATAHISIVARGKVRAYSEAWSIEAAAGQIIDFLPDQPHELAALEDGTRVVNIVKKFGGTSA